MSLARDDRWVADAQGRALAGAQVYWCTQPATTTTNPPSPLATAYLDINGSVPLTQPAISDGFGHAYAYLDDSVLYTVVIWHPLFGTNPVVLPDQSIGGGGGSNLIPFEGVLDGTIDGANKVFTLTNNGVALTVAPAQATVWLNFPLVVNVGYTISGVTVTFTNAPITGDTLYASGLIAA